MSGDSWALIIGGGVAALFVLNMLNKGGVIALVYFTGAALSTTIAAYGAVQASRFDHTDWNVPAAFGAMAVVQWLMFRGQVRR